MSSLVFYLLIRVVELPLVPLNYLPMTLLVALVADWFSIGSSSRGSSSSLGVSYDIMSAYYIAWTIMVRLNSLGPYDGLRWR